jgi:hypothetical protein
MVNPVSNATKVAAVQQSAPARQPAPAASPKPQPAITDTVQISAAAQALQEATETSVQTSQEARSGDAQAQRLQAKEQAAQGSSK